MAQEAKAIGIIGGSGLYHMPGLEVVAEHAIETPFGSPSDPVVEGRFEGQTVFFIARHGKGHRLLPSEVPYQANIFALKQLGVGYILSFSAVGSLQEHMKPLDFVVPDQYLDFTKSRKSTFFGEGVVAHVSMAQPVCPALSALLYQAAQSLSEEVTVHQGGTYVCMEGPQFSSLAESLFYRSLNASVIGMTNMPEAKLAREAQIAYASLAMVTDFDCWHPKEADVTAESAIANLMKNAERAVLVAQAAIRAIAADAPSSEAHVALSTGLVTPLEAMTDDKKAMVEVLAS
ncbi:MAG: S-methyl-5'-thioadenosine phosphorylase [Pontibacterium sp.]